MPTMKVLDEKTGEKRDPTPEEVSQLIDEGVILNESGADLLTRWMTKTFAANPEQAKGFLERRGFEVMAGKRAGEFAVRNRNLDSLLGGSKNNPWKVLDPSRFEAADIVDVAFDVFIAGPIIAGGVGAGAASGLAIAAPTASVTGPVGPVAGAAAGGAAGGGLASAGVEAARQAAGRLLGVNTEMDPGGVATAGALGAVLPGAGRAAARFPSALLRLGKFAGKKAALIGKNLAARVAGTTEEELATAAGSATRAATILKEKAAKPVELLDRMRGTIQQLRDKANLFPERREMEAILEKARPVPLRGLMSILQQQKVQPIGTEKVGLRSGRQMAEQIAHKLGFRTAKEAANGTVTAKQAEELKQTLQAQIDFSGRPGEKFLNRVLKEAQGNLRNRIVAAIPSAQARARYRSLNGFGSYTDAAGKFHAGRGVVGKMEAMNEIDRRMGEHLKTQSAETFLERIAGQGRTQERRLVEQFDRLFGTNFVEEGLTTRLATKFSGDAPKLTATGQFIGPGTGAAVGAALGSAGGPAGAAAGAAAGTVAGFIAATPKGMLRIGQGITRLERTGRMTLRRAGEAVRHVEPLADYLARTGGGAIASGAPRLLPSHEPTIPDE